MKPQMTGHTPGPWMFREWATEDDPVKLKQLGLEPTPALTNDGQRSVMAGDRHVAFVSCQVAYKRGTGHQSTCAIRDANARLIAAAPELLEQAKIARLNLETVQDELSEGQRLDYHNLCAAIASAEGRAGEPNGGIIP